jgi:hypothetical protein
LQTAEARAAIPKLFEGVPEKIKKETEPLKPKIEPAKK